MTNVYLKRAATLATITALAASAWAQAVATVDGVGGAPTGDPVFATSYANINAALVDVQTSETAAGTIVRITTANLTSTAGINMNMDQNLTIESNVSGGTHLRITESGIGISGAVCAMVANIADNKSVTLRNLIITPGTGVAGPVNARAIQVYGRTAAPTLGTTYAFNTENVILTALQVTPNTPVLNPFVHAASANTIAARNAELRAFDGGGANNAVEIRFVGAAESNSVLTVNLTNTVITHTIAAAAANKGGGIAVSRSRGVAVNINQGSVISYNSGSGMRGVGTLQSATTTFTVVGTAPNPAFFLYNGWLEDAANTARNEGIQNDGSDLTVNHAYFIGHFQENIDKRGAGVVSISNSYFANAQTDLDTGNGAPPNIAGAANILLANNVGATLTNVTIFNNLGSTNQEGIRWNAAAAASQLSLNNVIIAGTGDGNTIGAANAVTYVQNNCAIVQSGPNALAATPITFGAGLPVGSRTITDEVTGDPLFISTTFAPGNAGLGVKPTGLTNYLAVNTSAYRSTRGGTAPINVTGANADSPLPVSMSEFMVE